MSNLKDLVPPPELFELIPKEKFQDSALVWHGVSTPVGYMHVLVRRNEVALNAFGFIYPAPTLAEILEALPTSISESKEKFYLYLLDTRNKPENDWQVGYAHEAFYGLYCSKKRKARDTNPATAALKLWLEVNGVASDPSAPSEASDKTQNAGHNSEEVKK